jgi:hypothetical protein
MNNIQTWDRFWRLIITDFLPKKKWQNRKVNCICDCGKSHTCFLFVLMTWNTKSCWCLRKELQTFHWYSKRGKVKKEYKCWQNMNRRCSEENNRDYHLYGGRWITVCERWKSFENFLSDMWDCPVWHSIDRIDTNGNYEPWNCKWSDIYEQAKNKRNTIWIEYKWESLCLAEWSRRLWIHRATLKDRIWKLGWTVDRAMETPVKTKLTKPFTSV